MKKKKKNIISYILSLTSNNNVFYVCKRWNELMIEVLYIFNKNNPKIYNLKVDYFDDFKYLMNIKTLEDIKENYNIPIILKEKELSNQLDRF